MATQRHQPDETLERAKDRAWRHVEALDGAHARGEIDDAAWHRGMADLVVPAYVETEDVRRASGHTGSAADWEWSRGIVDDAIDRSGTFLDVGCANGLLMQSVARWGLERGLAIEPYGIDIVGEMIDVARARLPGWADRLFTGNALGWTPPLRFDIVRTGLEYVPRSRRRELVSWLLDEVVAPGGRLIIGKFNEEMDDRATERQLAAWGIAVTDPCERAHRTEPRLAYRALAIDNPRREPGEPSFRALRRDDFALLPGWLAEPHVVRWWREPLDLAGVAAKYTPRITGDEPSHVHLILLDAQPIGWIQWYRWSSYPEHAARIGAEPSEAGVDLAIGDPAFIGRSLGSRVLRAFVDDVVFAHRSITGCVSDPDPANPRSVRAFENAGFTALHERAPFIVRRDRPR